MTIKDGARLYSDGTLGFSAGKGASLMGDSPQIGGRYLSFAAPSINIGSQDALDGAAAAGVLPQGLNFTQAFMDRLLKGDPASGAPATETLSLRAADSFNVFGNAVIDTFDPVTGKSRLAELVLATPAIYGAGEPGDEALFRTDRLVWSGITNTIPDPLKQGQLPEYAGASKQVSNRPGQVLAGGPGTGSGRLRIEVGELVLGYPNRNLTDSLTPGDRLALGFSSLEISASRKVISNRVGSLNVYRSGPSPDAGYDPATYAGSGGVLSIVTPVLRAAGGSSAHYRAGDRLSITAGDGAKPAVVSSDHMGGSLYFRANSILVDTAIAAPSGLVSLLAANDLVLGEGSLIDVAGRALTFFDVTRDTWGGEVRLESTSGNIIQAAGGVIDVSAPGSDAGRIHAAATNASAGSVLLGGSLKGEGGAGHDGGFVDIRAQLIGADAGTLTADFAAFNERLRLGGFTGGRAFVLKRGDLAIDSIKTREMVVSVDGGSLTVNGVLDASGTRPGSIRLAARDDLTIGAGAVLDVHGSELRKDAYGGVIEASNRGNIELAARKGTLTLADGARMDLSSPDGVARGRIELSAPRVGSGGVSATGAGGPANAKAGDIAIAAGGQLHIAGAAHVAVNGTARYDNARPDSANPGGQVVDQAFLDLVHVDSQAFSAGALANADLQARLAGLQGHGAAVHVRPGVEIVSATADGDITVRDNLQLSAYRYGPDANVLGAGEPMRLTIAAGGDLAVHGSITDGFLAGWSLNSYGEYDELMGSYSALFTVPFGGYRLSSNSTIGGNTTTGFGAPPPSTLPGGPTQTFALTFDAELRAGTLIRNGITIPFEFYGNGAISVPTWTFSQGWELTAAMTVPSAGIAASLFGTTPNRRIVLPDGTTYSRTTAVPGNMVLPAGTKIYPGTNAAGTAGVAWSLSLSGARFAAGSTLPSASATISSGTTSVRGGIATTAPLAVPVGTLLSVFGATVTLAADANVPAGTVLPSGARLAGTFMVESSTPNLAGGAMIAAGRQSASIRLVGGADTGAADTRTLQPYSVLNHAGNVLLSNHKTDPMTGAVYTSVIRTGTGDLDLLSGGDITWKSYFGVYTAGTQTKAPQGFAGGGGLYFPEYGGDLLAIAQGDLIGSTYWSYAFDPNTWELLYRDSRMGTWLTRSKGQTAAGRYWGINFGVAGSSGFNGLGTLGGGNATILVGGNAGNLDRVPHDAYYEPISSNALTFAIASTGRVTGTGPNDMMLTGGGDLKMRIGGRLNHGHSSYIRPDLNSSFVNLRGDMEMQAASIGAVKLTYGRARVYDPRQPDPWAATQGEGVGGPMLILGDSRALWRSGGDLVMGAYGDGGVSTNPSDAGSSGFLLHTDRTAIDLFSVGGEVVPYGLMRSTNTALDSIGDGVLPSQLRVVAGGGSIHRGVSGSNIGMTFADPVHLLPSRNGHLELLARDSIYSEGSAWLVSNLDPAFLIGPRTDGYISKGTGLSGANYNDLLFMTTLYSKVSGIAHQDMVHSLAVPTDLLKDATDPIRFYAVNGDIINLQTGTQLRGAYTTGGIRLNRWYGTGKHVSIMAGRDIVNLGGLPTQTFTGQRYPNVYNGKILNLNPTDVSRISAGRDIYYVALEVGGPGSLEITAGRNFYQGDGRAEIGTMPSDAGQWFQPGQIVSVGPMVPGDTRRGADITVAAGMANGVEFDRFLDLYLTPGNRADPKRPLAEPNGVTEDGLVTQVNKVLLTYGGELTLAAWLAGEFGYTGDEAGAQAFLATKDTELTRRDLVEEYRRAGSAYLVNWLRERYAFGGTAEEARAFFDKLAPEQRRILARNIYYAEIKAGGREYNNPGNPRFGSYLRGRLAVAALFPDADAAGNEIVRSGDITMFSTAEIVSQRVRVSGKLTDVNTIVTHDGAVRTLFGGDIQFMAPGGSVVAGIEGTVPGAKAGIVTQGRGDISIFSEQSLLLGLSRIMTTFGGSILAWSEQGDINAGRGSKSTVVYTPARRVYDAYGNITLSPTVPSSGAGIATLNPIPEVPAGDIDLIAPLGTIDAGEAGIRVSGNINLAAHQVLNAANIQVQGESAGMPVAVRVNTGALTSASSAASAVANQAAELAERARPKVRPDIPTIITVRFVGFGE